MCMTCGCGEPTKKHPHSHALVWDDLTAAATDAEISPEKAAENLLSATESMKEMASALDVFKSTPELRYTLGVAYPVNRVDAGKGADGFQDFASEDILREAAWNFMRNGARIGLDHEPGTDGAGTVVESYIWPGDPWPQDNGYVVHPGDWLLGVIWSEEVWMLIKRGLRRGFSIQGAATRRLPSSESLALVRRDHEHN